MAMTGLQIFKLLPNKNCGECGVPTCLAFAMKLAAKTAEPQACPYLSPQAQEILGASQAPPVKQLTFALKTRTYRIGGETVLYRHEKTFVNKPLVCLELSDALSQDVFTQRLTHARSLGFDRVGERLEPEGFSLRYDSGDPAVFLKKLVAMDDADRVLVLPVLPDDLMRHVFSRMTNPSRLIARAPVESVPAGVKVLVSADDPDSLYEAVREAEAAGLRDLILHLRSRTAGEQARDCSQLRRRAIQEGFKPAGYPLYVECSDTLASATAGICKYASIIVLREYAPEALLPLLTLRQNIYTDPQKPLQIKPGVYRVGEPGADAPLLVTTNFSLTYFIVSAEVDNSPFRARLLVTDSEGMSVLTAWSANKLTAAIVAKAVRDTGVEREIIHRKLIIPGYIAVLKGEIEESLPGWEILVGPQEAADISVFLKEVWAATS